MSNSNQMAHLSDRAKIAVSLSSGEKIQYLHRWMWIYSDAAEKVEAIVRRMMKVDHPVQAPCLLVVGPSGIGKTSMISYLQQHVFSRDAGVIFFDSRHCLSYKAFLLKFATQLQIPARAHRSSTSSQLELELDRAISLRGIKVMVIDNIHDLMRGSRSDQRNVLTFLRELSASHHPVSVICFAIPSFSTALTSDEQLQERFLTYPLPLWKDNSEFRGFLTSVEAELPLRMPSNLISSECTKHLITYGNGITKKIIECIKHAAIAAVISGEERVTLDLLRTWGSRPFQYGDWSADE